MIPLVFPFRLWKFLECDTLGVSQLRLDQAEELAFGWCRKGAPATPRAGFKGQTPFHELSQAAEPELLPEFPTILAEPRVQWRSHPLQWPGLTLLKHLWTQPGEKASLRPTYHCVSSKYFTLTVIHPQIMPVPLWIIQQFNIYCPSSHRKAVDNVFGHNCLSNVTFLSVSCEIFH